MWLRCAVTFLVAFILDLHTAKLLQCCTVQHSDVNMIQRGIESGLFSISSGKTDSSEATNSQLWPGWMEAYVIC